MSIRATGALGASSSVEMRKKWISDVRKRFDDNESELLVAAERAMQRREFDTFDLIVESEKEKTRTANYQKDLSDQRAIRTQLARETELVREQRHLLAIEQIRLDDELQQSVSQSKIVDNELEQIKQRQANRKSHKSWMKQKADQREQQRKLLNKRIKHLNEGHLNDFLRSSVKSANNEIAKDAFRLNQLSHAMRRDILSKQHTLHTNVMRSQRQTEHSDPLDYDIKQSRLRYERAAEESFQLEMRTIRRNNDKHFSEMKQLYDTSSLPHSSKISREETRPEVIDDSDWMDQNIEAVRRENQLRVLDQREKIARRMRSDEERRASNQRHEIEITDSRRQMMRENEDRWEIELQEVANRQQAAYNKLDELTQRSMHNAAHFDDQLSADAINFSSLRQRSDSLHNRETTDLLIRSLRTLDDVTFREQISDRNESITNTNFNNSKTDSNRRLTVCDIIKEIDATQIEVPQPASKQSIVVSKQQHSIKHSSLPSSASNDDVNHVPDSSNNNNNNNNRSSTSTSGPCDRQKMSSSNERSSLGDN
eukprot:TRINITY_DN10597_c0_g2_i1.p1 TRINITY_DN10597_c0_g2~~TRINITY_DN10597_c0_g2_i1.p1  ORF type:complete len:539 (+),score=123.63 TRINITY_DN10597_c0_g2_i1:83-1699(+)